VYTGSITDKVRVVGDQFSLIHFAQKNFIPNNTGSLLHLIFTYSKSTQVFQTVDTLVPCDSYHPALSITCPCPSAIPMLDAKHTYRDFKRANYEKIFDNLVNIDSFNSRSTDQSVDFLQKALLDSIRD